MSSQGNTSNDSGDNDTKKLTKLIEQAGNQIQNEKQADLLEIIKENKPIKR